MAERHLMLPGEIVKKSNAIARAKWSPKSVWEPRVVALVASKVRHDDHDFCTYRIPVSELCGEADLSGKRYNDIKNAIENMMRAYVVLEEEPGFMTYSLFSKCGYKNGYIVAEFHPDLKPHYLGLSKHFTQYNLIEFLKLRSIYTQRLFEILKSWSDRPDVEIDLMRLHKMLGTPDSQRKTFGEFRRRVLDRSCTEINLNTSVSYSWEPIKTGRRVSAVRFIFSKHRQVATAKRQERATQDQNNKLFIQASRCLQKHKQHCSQENPNTKATCAFCQKHLQR